MDISECIDSSFYVTPGIQVILSPLQREIILWHAFPVCRQAWMVVVLLLSTSFRMRLSVEINRLWKWNIELEYQPKMRRFYQMWLRLSSMYLRPQPCIGWQTRGCRIFVATFIVSCNWSTNIKWKFSIRALVLVALHQTGLVVSPWAQKLHTNMKWNQR